MNFNELLKSCMKRKMGIIGQNILPCFILKNDDTNLSFKAGIGFYLAMMTKVLVGQYFSRVAFTVSKYNVPLIHIFTIVLLFIVLKNDSKVCCM